MILIDLFSIIFLNSIKYKDIPTPDYALAYATPMKNLYLTIFYASMIY